MSTNVNNQVGLILAAIVIYYVYQVAARKKVRLQYKLRSVLVFGLVFYPVLLLGSRQFPQTEAAVIAFLSGFVVSSLLIKAPKRSRYIPRAVRRAVIKRDLGRKKLDGRKHHLDHVVPYSKGGDNSVRNLRVIEKKKNLKKGNKMPSIWDF
ncbi:MAG TPA: HNH endonuclease signature motif containing protein [Blastocatellia bacterium]|nr:HNH endonuclease signature motif containing protein [Blastocatellia bacterium]